MKKKDFYDFESLYLAKMHSIQILFFNNLIGINMNLKM